MRDISRIYPLCNKLAEYWGQNPDLRFCQFIYNFMHWIYNYKRIDPFYVEDDKMLEYLKEYMKDEEWV